MSNESATGSMPFVPIFTEAMQFHSSRDPGECTLTPAQCDLMNGYWVFKYHVDWVYSLKVVYFFLLVISLFAIRRWAPELAPAAITNTKRWCRCVSAVRFISYKDLRIGRWRSQPLGVYLIALVGIAFFLAMTLFPQPYYWPTDAFYGDVPPLGSRAGWLGLACMPFIFAFGAKANLVSALTGVSSDKLIIWHSWVSWAMLVLAYTHAFPCIIYHQRKGDMAQTFRTGALWLTGVIALFSQTWLTLMSVTWIRNRWYEFFKLTHYFFALVFMVCFFIHCSFRLSSWDYFIATGTIYLASLVYSWAKTYVKHGFKHSARLCLETPQALRVAIPTDVKWKPGQHAYVQFLAGHLHPLTAHPFTICSLPAGKGSEMVFHIQPRRGITRRLAHMAQTQPDAGVKVLIEGPYGGMCARWYKGFDRTILIAGGSGSAFTLSLIEDWLSRQESGSTAQLNVILVTRDAEMRLLYTQELKRIAERQCDPDLVEIPGVSISFYETYKAEVRLVAPTPRLASYRGHDDEENGTRGDYDDDDDEEEEVAVVVEEKSRAGEEREGDQVEGNRNKGEEIQVEEKQIKGEGVEEKSNTADDDEAKSETDNDDEVKSSKAEEDSEEETINGDEEEGEGESVNKEEDNDTEMGSSGENEEEKKSNSEAAEEEKKSILKVDDESKNGCGKEDNSAKGGDNDEEDEEKTDNENEDDDGVEKEEGKNKKEFDNQEKEKANDITTDERRSEEAEYYCEVQKKKTNEKRGKEITLVAAAGLFNIGFFSGRPALVDLVRETSLETDGTVGVAVCGPAGLIHTVAREAAEQQKRIVKGLPGASEVWFHREGFSY